MAIQGISYWSCKTHRERFLGINDSTGDITGHPTLGPDPGGLPAQDDIYDTDQACLTVAEKIFEDANWIVWANIEYPYGYVESVTSPPDPPAPPSVVCNLSFIASLQSMTNASIPGVADGSFTVVALEKYVDQTTYPRKANLNSDFDYATEGVTGTSIATYQTQFSFSGLLAGTYTVYVRRSADCLATVSVVVGVDGGDGGIGGGDGDGGATDTGALYPKYNLSFDDIDGKTLAETRYKLEILEYAYTGAVTEIKGGDSNVVISWRNEANEDPFTPVIPSELQATIISETDQEFLGFVTYDERKYKGKLYEYVSGAYTLKWVGWMLPMTYTEPYHTNTNYPINLSFVDFGGLSTKPFTTTGGTPFTGRMDFFTAIRACLYHTGINMEIWESVNIYTSTMDSADADSPLTQMYFDPTIYVDSDGDPLDCRTVLDSLLLNVGSRIYQSDGRWNIELITQKLASSVLTRKYGLDGVYYGNESVPPRIALRKGSGDIPSPKVSFRDVSQSLNIPLNYGSITVDYDLGIEKVNNLLQEGEFVPIDAANGQYVGWSVIPSANASWSVYNLAEKRGDSDTALQVSFVGTNYSNYVDLVSSPVNITWPGDSYMLNVKFDVYARPTHSKAHTFLDFSVGLNDNKILLIPSGNTDTFFTSYNAAGGWIDGIYNRVFLDSSLQWSEINIKAIVYSEVLSAINTAGNLTFQIRLRSNPDFDVDTITTLRTLKTNPFDIEGKLVKIQYPKVRVRDGGFIRVYNLEDGTDADNSPDVVRPNDYGTNAYMVWKLDYTVAATAANWLQSILITNIQIGYYPNSYPLINKPKIILTKQITLNNNINKDYKKTVIFGDITDEIDANYRYLSKGILTYSDESNFTGGWTRKDGDENKYLHELLAAMYQGQFQSNRWRLTGTLISKGVSPSFFNTFQEYRTGRIYTAISMENDLRNKSIRIEMIEALKGTATTDEGVPTPDPIEPPISTKEHTNEFTNEFK